MANDEFDGVGGSYLIDPKTEKRTLIERTAEADDIKKTDSASDDLKGVKDATIN